MKKYIFSLIFSSVLLTSCNGGASTGSNNENQIEIEPTPKLIIADIKQLPSNVILNQSYPVIFTFANTSDVAATDVKLTTNYPINFIEQANNCKSGVIAAHDSCQISGIYNVKSDADVVISAILEAKNVKAIEAKTSSKVSEVNVTGKISADITNMALNHQYPVIITFTNNDSKHSATGLKFTNSFPANFTPQDDKCAKISQLTANSSCDIIGEYKANTPGTIAIKSELAYAEGKSTVTVEEHGQVSEVSLNAEFETDLADHTLLGKAYPVLITVHNLSKIPATNLEITKIGNDVFTLDNNSTCIKQNSIPAEGLCQISGTFKSEKSEPSEIGVTISYKEGTLIKKQISTIVTDISIQSTIEHPLPANILPDTNYLVEVAFKNENLHHQVLNLKTISTNKNFTLLADSNCNGSILADHYCSIKGNYKAAANEMGLQKLDLTLEYTNGADEPVLVPVSIATNVSNVAVTSKVIADLPPQIEIGVPYPVHFEFDNSSPLPATNVNVSLLDPTFSFKPSINNCTSTTIAANGKCEVKGTFTAQNIGNISIGAILSYKEGADVEIKSRISHVSKVAVKEETLVAIPDHIEAGKLYDFKFKFTNQSKEFSARGVKFNLSSNGVTSDVALNYTKNECQGLSVLSANGSCEVSGTYQYNGVDTASKPWNLNAEFEYDQAAGVPLTVKFEPTVHQAKVSYDSITDLPAKIAPGFSYPASITITNDKPFPTSLKVLGVNITKGQGKIEKLDSSACGTELAAYASCNISFEYSNETTNGTAEILFKLAYGIKQQVLNYSFTSSSSKLDVRVNKSQLLPQHIKPNTEYPLKFIFENHSEVEIKTTEISIPAEIKVTKNQCKDFALSAKNGSCTIEATYKTGSNTSTTNIRLEKVALYYRDVNSTPETAPKLIQIITSSTLSKPDLTVSVDNEYFIGVFNQFDPQNYIHPGNITIRNTSNHRVDNLKAVINYPGMKILDNSCQKSNDSLNVNQECKIKFTFRLAKSITDTTLTITANDGVSHLISRRIYAVPVEEKIINLADPTTHRGELALHNGKWSTFAGPNLNLDGIVTGVPDSFGQQNCIENSSTVSPVLVRVKNQTRLDIFEVKMHRVGILNSTTCAINDFVAHTLGGRLAFERVKTPTSTATNPYLADFLLYHTSKPLADLIKSDSIYTIGNNMKIYLIRLQYRYSSN